MQEHEQRCLETAEFLWEDDGGELPAPPAAECEEVASLHDALAQLRPPGAEESSLGPDWGRDLLRGIC